MDGPRVFMTETARGVFGHPALVHCLSLAPGVVASYGIYEWLAVTKSRLLQMMQL
jgi:hypothetical protein